MKVSSRDLYRELRAVLGPLMKRSGFRVLAGGRPGWARQGPAGCLELRVRNNAVIARSPGTLAHEAVVNVLDDGTEAEAAIFEDYIAREPDAHFRAAAEHWLANVRDKLRR